MRTQWDKGLAHSKRSRNHHCYYRWYVPLSQYFIHTCFHVWFCGPMRTAARAVEYCYCKSLMWALTYVNSTSEMPRNWHIHHSDKRCWITAVFVPCGVSWNSPHLLSHWSSSLSFLILLSCPLEVLVQWGWRVHWSVWRRTGWVSALPACPFPISSMEQLILFLLGSQSTSGNPGFTQRPPGIFIHWAEMFRLLWVKLI